MSFLAFSCDRGPDSHDPDSGGPFSTDQEVFTFISQTDPYHQYTVFPHADSVVAGSLNGSTAHRPMVRVSMNTRAVESLENGRFPTGGFFRDSSVVLKEIRDGGSTTLIAVVIKQPEHPLSAGGWLWAEYEPDGTVFYPVQNSGAGCLPCHSLEQGPQHDFIRTFERQSP